MKGPPWENMRGNWPEPSHDVWSGPLVRSSEMGIDAADGGRWARKSYSDCHLFLIMRPSVVRLQRAMSLRFKLTPAVTGTAAPP